MTTRASDAAQAKKENEAEVQIKRILVPIDCSNCSMVFTKIFAVLVAAIAVQYIVEGAKHLTR